MLNEWGVFLVISSVLVFCIAWATPLAKLIKVLDTLTVEVKALNNEMRELKEKNSESHNNLWDRLNKHHDKLSEHDKDIGILKTEIKSLERDV